MTRDLVVDLTPTCVNKTAIRHIALDTMDALGSPFRTILQYRGIRFARLPEPAQQREIAALFREDLARWSREPPGTPTFLAENDKAPRLYFDPIYTLYRPLEPHDLVFVLDLSPLTDPDWHDATVSQVYARAFDHVMRSRAKIVCISENCAAALRATFAVSSADVTTVPLYLRTFGHREDDRPETSFPFLAEKRFFLFVGSLEARKNLIGLMRAFAMTGLADEGWRLVCAGGNGHGAETILEAAGELSGVDLAGFVSDTELDWLYKNAAAFVYPSFLEGFGLPLLEAMAHGLPFLASITGASQEVCGDLGILVDPYDASSIAEGLEICAAKGQTSPRHRLVSRAQQFTFARFAEALIPAIERAAA